MPFLGSTPADQYQSLAKQTITGDGSTAYTLNRSVTNAYDMEVFINNVRQEPDTSYTASGNTITFTAAVTSGDSCYLIYQGQSVGSINPPANSVGSSQVANNTITTAHLHTGLSVPDSNIAAMAASKLTGNVAAANMSAGSVLQVITKHCPSNANTISTTSYTAVGLDITITPKRSGSHFLAQAFWLVYDQGGSGTLKVESALFRNGTNITGNLTHTPYNGTGQGERMPYGGQSTADTGANAVAGTAISYSYKFKKNSTGEVTYDVAHNDGKSAFLTIMEIAQ